MYYIASYLVYWFNQMYEGDFPPGGRAWVFDTVQEVDTFAIEKYRVERNLKLQAWPNPTADEFRLGVEREIGAGIVQVADAQGKVYIQRRFASSDDLAQRPFSLAGLPAGAYVVRLLASDWYMGATVVVKQ
ncbi:MAG: T9SS type A sorting domain-containing protein, partial [Bacteroidales bacterium]|nr:T9SS type A sorting domain-containing protein [Bacteroidales bacterium]